MNYKIICTTSDKNMHCLKIFMFLFNKYWSSEQFVEIVGYSLPTFPLLPNFTYHSLGKQSDSNKDFSNDLRKYFEQQDAWIVWLMEDYFLTEPVNFKTLESCYNLTAMAGVGRINITKECVMQDHVYLGKYDEEIAIYENTQTARYRLSTQSSIWNKQFLLQYMKPNLNPWEFETQESVNDGWRILGLGKEDSPVKHNEGVRRFDVHKFNLEGISEDVMQEMKQLKFI